jgi:hypothetical protein
MCNKERSIRMSRCVSMNLWSVDPNSAFSYTYSSASAWLWQCSLSLHRFSGPCYPSTSGFVVGSFVSFLGDTLNENEWTNGHASRFTITPVHWHCHVIYGLSPYPSGTAFRKTGSYTRRGRNASSVRTGRKCMQYGWNHFFQNLVFLLIQLPAIICHARPTSQGSSDKCHPRR